MAAAPYIWQEPVPADLHLFAGQKLRATGMEVWRHAWGVPRDWEYVLWDWVDDDNVLRCRYSGWVVIAWNPGNHWLGWPPQNPFQGAVQEVREAKNRPRRNSLALLDNLDTPNMNLVYSVEIVGCYVPADT